MLITFSSPIQPKETLTHKIKGGRKQALWRRTADTWEIDKARARRQAAVETEKIARYHQIMNKEMERSTQI